MNKLFTLLLLGLSLSAQSQFVDFESFDIEIDTFLNGSDLLGTFEEDFAILPNSFDTTFSSWSGWSISSMRDTTTPGFMNQYSAITGGGFGSSQNYAVSFSSSGNQIKLDSAYQGRTLAGMYITNSTYAYLSMLDGDAFAKKFGGETGEDPDFFLLTIKGFINGAMTTDSIDFYLADFRFEDNSQDYIVDAWTFVDLSPLGAVDSLSFSLTSSDVGDFGMNTPAYFCMDKVELESLPTSLFPSIPQRLTLHIYPNPSADYIQIDQAQPLTYQIFDLQGRQLASPTRLIPGESISVSHLPQGNYFLQVQEGEKLGGGWFVRR